MNHFDFPVIHVPVISPRCESLVGCVGATIEDQLCRRSACLQLSGGRLACRRGRHLAARNRGPNFTSCRNFQMPTRVSSVFSAGRDAPALRQARTPAATIEGDP
jgi:hypothetical protein